MTTDTISNVERSAQGLYYQVEPMKPVALAVGQQVKLDGERQWWAVRGVAGEHVAVLTRQAPFRRRGALEYTVLDWRSGVRGPVNVIGQGWGVDTEGVKVDNGQTAGLNSSVRTRPERGMPRLILRGNFAGSVVVRHPRWADRRALTKWERLGRPAPALALPPGPVGSGHV